MKPTAEQRVAFERWVRRKVEHHTCQLCQSNHWKVGEVLVPHTSDSVEEFVSPGPSMVQLVCQNCAHVLLFDVRMIEDWSPISPSQSAIM
jgi:hypothetical protein